MVELSQHSKDLVENAKKVYGQVHQHQEDEGPPKSRLHLSTFFKVIKDEAGPQGHQEGDLIHQLYAIQIQIGEGPLPKVEDKGSQSCLHAEEELDPQVLSQEDNREGEDQALAKEQGDVVERGLVLVVV